LTISATSAATAFVSPSDEGLPSSTYGRSVPSVPPSVHHAKLGSPGAVNEITVSQAGVVSSPPHLSKGEGYVLAPEDWIAVKTPGGGGYGPAPERDPAMVERDIARGYYTDVEAVRRHCQENGLLDRRGTA
jgi:hypothetical protein